MNNESSQFSRIVKPVHLIFVAFALSGATSLVYQVVWMRMLSLFFGSDVYAAAITLSVFMGGLSLGSWLASRFGDVQKRPLVTYGLCEILIAAFALAFPILLDGLHEIYQHTYLVTFDTQPWLYHFLRLGIAGLALLGPTVLMGATLPLIIRQFADSPENLGRYAGSFYAVNTIGALFGTLITGFAALPLIGITATTKIAVLINLIIGCASVIIGLKFQEVKTAGRSGGYRTVFDQRQKAIILAMLISGLAALALEVVWMRILVQSFSATVYAFAIMLASFLFGIFYGSRIASTTIDSHPDPLDLLITLEFWLGASVAILGLASWLVPGLFGALIWGLVGIMGGAFGIASVMAQGIVAMLLIVAPTLLLGATFPVAVKALTRDIEQRSASSGIIYAANTAGALVGALIGGFILLPLFGARNSLIIIPILFLLGGIVAARGRGGSPIWHKPHIRITGAIVVATSIGMIMLPTKTVINFNAQRNANPEVLFHGEGVAHTIDIVRSDKGQTIMMVNGNIEADTTLIQRRHFIMKAHLPLLLRPEAADVAVVGLGLGITLQAIDRNPAVKSIRLIELAPEMVKAHRLLPELAGHVLDSPKLKLRIDDGRNFMAMTNETFDMITADPIHPRITGVGYLYTREYYELIKRRLRPGGIVVQWMPMYQIHPRSFDVALRTFANVFPNSMLWYMRGHGLLVATLEPLNLDWPTLSKRFADAKVTEDFDSIGISHPEQLLGYLLMDAEHITRYVGRTGGVSVNTDNNAYLEYRTPYEFLGRTESIIAELLPYAGWDIDKAIGNAPIEAKSGIIAAFEERLRRIPAELNEPIN